MIRAADQRADARLLHAEFPEKFLRFVRREVNQIAFDLRADDHGFAGDVGAWRIRALSFDVRVGVGGGKFGFLDVRRAKMVALSVSR